MKEINPKNIALILIMLFSILSVLFWTWSLLSDFFKSRKKNKIDQILYYFGYAPIKISHEVKTIYTVDIVCLEIETDAFVHEITKTKNIVTQKMLVKVIDYITFDEKTENGLTTIAARLCVKKKPS